MQYHVSTVLRVVNHFTAMVAYWDLSQRCVFANGAYLEWFGRTPEEMKGISLKELLGPLYVLNLPHIEAAFLGKPQVFERRIPLPNGGFRDSLATYTPDIVDGKVHGFSAHVADVTLMKEREAFWCIHLRCLHRPILFEKLSRKVSPKRNAPEWALIC